MSVCFTSRAAKESPSKDRLIEYLLPQFKVDEQAVFIDNGLSTRVLCFPSDRLHIRAPQLSARIDHAMEYACRFFDIETLNALLCLPKHYTDSRAAIALYVYLADVSSQTAPNTTFLTAMRDAGACLKSDEILTPERERQLADAIKRALVTLHMEAYLPVIDEWHETGRFHIAGERQSVDTAGTAHGAYGRLAFQIVRGDPQPTLNRSISYVLANRHITKSLKTDEERLRHTEGLIEGDIEQLIHRGTDERRAAFKKLVGNLVQPATPSSESRKTAKGILSLLSSDMLEILWRKDYTVAYANADRIKTLMPKDAWPGVPQDKHEFNMGCKGLHQNLYRTIFTSNGMRDDVPIENDAMRYRIVAQSLGHECLHSAILEIGKKNASDLKKAVLKLGEEIHRMPTDIDFLSPFVTVDDSYPLQVLYSESKRYNPEPKIKGTKILNGYEVDDRWEEVACEVAGLEAGDCKRLDRLNGKLPALTEVRAEIANVMHEAVERCRARDRSKPSCRSVV